METAEAKKLTDLTALVDEGGQLDEDVKEKTKQLKKVKTDTGIEAEKVCEDGESLTLVGNIFQADVAFSPAMKDMPEGLADVIDEVDPEIGKKLFPYSVEETHYAFLNDADALKELKESDPELFKRLFKRVNRKVERGPNQAEISKALRATSKSKEKQQVKSILMRHVARWFVKSVSFKRRAED